MADPKAQLLSFPLGLGMDNVSFDEAVQPFGQAPALVESRNTRLTKTPGCVSKSPGTTLLSSGTTGRNNCYGHVPCGAAQATAAFYSPYGSDSRVIFASGSRKLSGQLAQSLAQSAYRPARVAFAEAESTPAVAMAPAIAYDTVNGWTFKAYFALSPSTGTGAVFVTATATDGAVIVPPTEIEAIAGTTAASPVWIGLSSHGATGIVLWYRNSANSIRMTPLTVGANYVLSYLPGGNAVYTPASVAGESIGLAYDTTDTTYAYLITFDSASLAAVAYHRVNVAAFAVTTVAGVASGTAAGDCLTIAYVQNGATQYLAAGISRAAATCTIRRLDPTTLALTWSGAGPAFYGQTSIGFYSDAVSTYVIQATNDDSTVASAANVGGVGFIARNWSTGVTGYAMDTVSWYRLVGRAVTHKVSSAEMQPLFTLTPAYASSATLATDPNFLLDPSIEVYTPHFRTYASTTTGTLNCVARFGVDMAARYRADIMVPGNSTFMEGNRYVCAYLTQVLGYDSATAGFPVRTIGLDFSPGQPRYALTSDGTAIVAAAMPVVWDGTSVAELSPIRAPKVYVATAGGSGPVLTTGAYRFAAVISWRDAQGQLHRSPPSDVITISGVGMQPIVYVTAPPSYKNGFDQPLYTVTVYASLVDGVNLYAQPYTTIPALPFWIGVSSVSQPIQGATTPALYSDGGATTAISALCLGVLRDVAVISDRAYAVCGERKARIFYSKPKEEGIFFEFNPSEMFIDLPASAGECVAVASFRDTPLFLTTTGIWTVAGDGPDALLNPPLFSAPQQISDVPCTSAASVVLCPVGLLYQSNDRYALFSGQSTIFPNLRASSVAGTAVFRNQQEVVFFLTTGFAHVYNYQANAWTLWDNETTAVNDITSFAQESLDGTVLYYTLEAADTYRINPDSVSTTAQIRLETGWALLGGPQDDNTVSTVALHERYGGAHGLEMTISTDYGNDQPMKVWSLSDTLNASLNSRSDLWAEPRDMPGRAVKVVFQETDAAGEGFQPVNATIQVLKNGGKMARSLRQKGMK